MPRPAGAPRGLKTQKHGVLGWHFHKLEYADKQLAGMASVAERRPFTES